jgi:HTH-type transcriptional regulator / antitoxin HipB
MKTFRNHLNSKLKSDTFNKSYSKEKQILELSLKMQEYRSKKGLSQSELAELAEVTQQQISRLEKGGNINISTCLKVCNALNLDISLKEVNKRHKAVLA